jgi:diguanylate cyclase (GGDEF)-like protein
MSFRLRLTGDTPSGGVPATPTDTTREWPGHTAQLRAALHRDQIDLHRDVVLWQRWVRYGALAVLAGLTLAFGTLDRRAILPLALVASTYVLFVGITAWMVERARGRALGSVLPSLLLVADVATLAALFYLSCAPAEQYRILVLGVLPVQLSVFYFGTRHGLLAAMLVPIAYVLTSVVVAPFVPGPAPAVRVLLLNGSIFFVVAATLVYTFGGFRSRMDRLRLFVTRVGEGELTAVSPAGNDRRPDDLTLLSRSFEAMRDRLSELVGTDPLTGCLNRRSLERQLVSAWRMAKRQETSIAVLAVDVDHFKEINDSLGHHAGDEVLQQLAEILRATARDTDSVARPGGDEFVVLLPNESWDGAMSFAERLRANVDDFMFGPAARPVRLTISVGVALARHTDAVSPEAVLEQADRSLYRAKAEGRNRVSA